MNRMPNMSKIPNLPLGNYYDQFPLKKEFPRSQTLGYFNGYAIQKGGPAAGCDLTDQELNDLMTYVPSITYPQTKQTDTESTFVPGFVAWDKKVLRFKAWFKETVPESPLENYRVRPVEIFYYLVDDSMAIVEPTVENSGLVQGKLVNRHRLPKNAIGDPWRWQDLNVGMDIGIYGRVFHIYDCDSWTRDFLESEGYEVNPSGSCPSDPYTESRTAKTEAPKKNEPPTEAQKLKQFLEMDRKVLRFYCIWDDRDTPYGDIRKVILQYYLANDTLEVLEVHKPNDGRDPFPLLMSRQKIPKVASKVKDSLPLTSLGLSGDQDPKDCLTPRDLWIGQTLDINGRRFLLCDCDEFTKAFYWKNFGLTNFIPIPVDDKGRRITQNTTEGANHTGHGCLEDSLESVTSLIPKPAGKDSVNSKDKQGIELRYEAILDSQRPEDRSRRFVICYRLEDDLMTIFEPPIKNSGFLGGRFLERSRVAKPGSCTEKPLFYGPQDFYIGAAVDVFRHRFIITNADAYVLKYMEQHPTQFPDDVIRSVRDKLRSEPNTQNGNSQSRRQQRSAAELRNIVQEVRGQLRKLSITASNRKDRVFLGVDVGRYGYITKDNIREMCLRQQLPADNDIIDALAQGIGKDADHITLEEFRNFLETDWSRY